MMNIEIEGIKKIPETEGELDPDLMIVEEVHLEFTDDERYCDYTYPIPAAHIPSRREIYEFLYH